MNNRFPLFLIALFLFFSLVCRAQITYKIDGFSQRYFVREHIEDPSQYINPANSPGWIAVYDKKSGNAILKVDVKRINGFTNLKLDTGIDVNMPYIGQEAVFYDDFNFDGKKDFALIDWTYNSDNWKTYKIFLAAADTFVFSAAFTDLTRGINGGMFQRDDKKRLLTVSNAKYGSDNTKIYQPAGDSLILLHAISTFISGPFVFTNIGQRNDSLGKLTFGYFTYINQKDTAIHALFSFRAKEKDKQIVLFSFGHKLYYALVRPDSTLEFYYGSRDDEHFIYDGDNNTTSFQKGLYTIFSNAEGSGICIKTKGGNHIWHADRNSKKGTLHNIESDNFGNVRYVSKRLTVNGFSKKYYGVVAVFSDAEYGKGGYISGPGWISIYDKTTHKELIKVDADDLFISLHKDSVKANIQQLPYGEQSVIIYEDFNFDGKKDFAIENGHQSCYGGPSFAVYLAKGDNMFKYNNGFTALASEHCGMFGVDPKTKTLHTMTKSGCCWHQYTTYSVVNNVPKAIKVIEEDAMDMPFVLTTTKTLNGREPITDTLVSLDLDTEPLLAFEIPDKHKKVVLFNLNNRLCYALLTQENEVEFYYGESENNRFVYDTHKNQLSFQGQLYTIYEKQSTIGIDIKQNGKTYDWKGNLSSKKGGLEQILKTNFDNVVLQ